MVYLLHSCLLLFFDFKFDPGPLLVNQLSCVYLGAQAIVANCFACLEHIKRHFQSVINIGQIALKVHVNRQLETLGDIGVAERTLHKETFLILLCRLRLSQRAMPVYRDYSIRIGF